MKLRLLTKEDAAIYLEIRLEGLKSNPEVFSTAMDDILDQEDPVKFKEEILDNDNDYTFGAFSEKGKLIGVVTLKTSEKTKSEHKGIISGLYVSPKARGLGAGKKLIEEAIYLAKSLGLEQITLNVVEGNLPAKKLYEKFGFKTFAVTPKSLKFQDEYWSQEHLMLFLKSREVYV